MHWNGKGDYWNTLLVLQLSSVLRLWTIVRTKFVQLTLLLHHWTILSIYYATIRRLLVLFYTTLRFYVSTFLRITLLLHHCTILRIYDATVRRLSVLFYTTIRLYASTMLLYAYCEFCFMPLYVSTHLRFYGSLCFYTPKVCQWMLDERQSYNVTSNTIHAWTRYAVVFYCAVLFLPWVSVQYDVKWAVET